MIRHVMPPRFSCPVVRGVQYQLSENNSTGIHFRFVFHHFRSSLCDLLFFILDFCKLLSWSPLPAAQTGGCDWPPLAVAGQGCSVLLTFGSRILAVRYHTITRSRRSTCAVACICKNCSSPASLVSNNKQLRHYHNNGRQLLQYSRG